MIMLCIYTLLEESDSFSGAPLDVCFLMMEFVGPSAEIRKLAMITLLDAERNWVNINNRLRMCRDVKKKRPNILKLK